MGSVASNVQKAPFVAKSNPSAPSILRLYNLEDKVFPYKMLQTIDSYPSVHLATSLSTFEDLVQSNLLLSPRTPEITKSEIDIYSNVINKEFMSEKILKNGDRIQKIYYDPIEDRGSLYLCRQFVVELSKEIAEITNLRILQACCNYLTSLPPEIGALQNLRVLVLSKNRIQKLPSGIGMLSGLKELNLSHNLLESFPDSISSLKSLNALHIDNNKFKKLPSSIGKLHSLKYLNVSYNRINNIPLEILKLPFLIELTANFCDFKNEEKITAVGCLTLKEVCSRHIIRNNLKIYRNIDTPMARYLVSVKECAFCSGPLFDHYFLFKTMHTFDSERLPVEYKLCSNHYESHDERIATLFSEPLKTYPYRLIGSNMPFVSDLFNQYCYTPKQMEILNNGWNSAYGKKMPLICLSNHVVNTERRVLQRKETNTDGEIDNNLNDPHTK